MNGNESVGIVLVSHSLKLADGTADVIRNLAGYVEIATAGGVHTMGATPGDVLNALEGMRSSNVLVFTDIGSSTIATLAALDVAPDELTGRVRVVNAPFVEGALLAGVSAMDNGTVAECLEAAESGLDLARRKVPTIASSEV